MRLPRSLRAARRRLPPSALNRDYHYSTTRDSGSLSYVFIRPPDLFATAKPLEWLLVVLRGLQHAGEEMIAFICIERGLSSHQCHRMARNRSRTHMRCLSTAHFSPFSPLVDPLRGGGGCGGLRESRRVVSRR
ncbi:hypothetical protein PM082_019636 [Marasmius tenuissimus]|nr:hypothetical protein PM082_019636 [Marasmius tenuissimus]